MARGNQRDKAREKNLKEQAGKVCFHHHFYFTQMPVSWLSLSFSKELLADLSTQKGKNTVCVHVERWT